MKGYTVDAYSNNNHIHGPFCARKGKRKDLCFTYINKSHLSFDFWSF